VVAYGDGWYGFNLSKVEIAERMDSLLARCRQSGRNVATLEIAVSLRDGSPEDAVELAAMGVTELVVVDAPPADPGDADRWVTAVANQWGLAD
jgi:hypothetical protein